jgi:hypothetical protein
MPYNPLQVTHWRDWEAAIFLLAINWYTVAGKFAPDEFALARMVRRWIEIQEPFEERKSQRLRDFHVGPDGQQDDGFNNRFIKQKWVTLRGEKSTRPAAIVAIASKILPHKAHIEQALNIRICYDVGDILPGRYAHPVATVLVDARGQITHSGTYKLKHWVGLGRVKPDSAEEDILKQARVQRESAYDDRHKPAPRRAGNRSGKRSATAAAKKAAAKKPASSSPERRR